MGFEQAALGCNPLGPQGFQPLIRSMHPLIISVLLTEQGAFGFILVRSRRHVNAIQTKEISERNKKTKASLELMGALLVLYNQRSRILCCMGLVAHRVGRFDLVRE